MAADDPNVYRRVVRKRTRGRAKTRRETAERCRNLYRFIRLRVGDSPSDRELARRWGIDWKSFVALKHGRRQVPRLDELEALAACLGVDPAYVFQVGGGGKPEAVAALLARDDRLRAVLDRVADAIFTIDANGRIQDLNRSFAQLVGRPPDKLAGVPLLDFAVPDSAPRLVAALATASRDGDARRAEVVLRRADGQQRVVELDLMRILDANGAAIGAQGVARDVTEERQLTRELDAQRRLVQSIYEHVPAACILFDRDGTILAANPLAENVCPASAAEMVGRSAFDVFGNPGPQGCPVTRSFLTGRTEHQVSLVRNRAGHPVYVYRTAGPIIRDGQVEKVIEMLVDVTDQLQRGDVRILALLRPQPEVESPPWVPERRSLPRARTFFTARCSYRGRQVNATVTSLGAGGGFIQLEPSDIAIGEELELEWALPGDGTPVQARGTVLWKRSDDDEGPPGVGVRFSEVTPPFAAAARGARNAS